MKRKKDIAAAIKDFEKTAADLDKLNQLMIEANAKQLRKWEKAAK